MGPDWPTVAPEMMPWVEKLYGADVFRERLFSKEPALAVLQTWEIETKNTPENNRDLQRLMVDGFETTRASIGKLEKGLQTDKDSAIALKFDAVVGQTIVGIKDPMQRQQVVKWIEQQQKAEQQRQREGAKLQGALQKHPGIQSMLKQPLWAAAGALGAKVMSSDMAVSAFRGTQHFVEPKQAQQAQAEQKPEAKGFFSSALKFGKQSFAAIADVGQTIVETGVKASPALGAAAAFVGGVRLRLRHPNHRRLRSRRRTRTMAAGLVD